MRLVFHELRITPLFITATKYLIRSSNRNFVNFLIANNNSTNNNNNKNKNNNNSTNNYLF